MQIIYYFLVFFVYDIVYIHSGIVSLYATIVGAAGIRLGEVLTGACND
jgi:hypothetical protein